MTTQIVNARSILYYDLETTMDWKTIHVAVWRYATRGPDGLWRPSGDTLVGIPGQPGWESFKAHVAACGALSAHNLIGFDNRRLVEQGIPVAHAEVVDTLPLARMLVPDNPGGHSLAALAPLVGKQKLKAPNEGDFDAFNWETDKAYAYGDVDAGIHVMCYLLNKMEALEFSRESVLLENETAVRVNEVTENGFPLDEEEAMRLLAALTDRAEAAKEEVGDMFWPNLLPRQVKVKADDVRQYVGPDQVAELRARFKGMPEPEPSKVGLWALTPCNLNSRDQLIERLIAMGWKPYKFTPKSLEAARLKKDASLKRPVLDDDALEELVHTGIPAGKALAEWFKVGKYLGFVRSWLKAVEDDGRIHCKILSIGAPTARMAHSTPNLAQVPKEKPWGPLCRKCFVPGDGKVQVGFDASGIEFRALLHYAQDPEMTKVALTGDIHAVHAGLMKDIGAPNHTRDHAKTYIYAWLFGAQAARVGGICGGDRDMGQAAIDALMRKWPGVGKLVQKVQKIAKSTGYLPGLDGRKLTVRSQHAALNTLLQSFGAIVMKKALLLFCERMEAEGIPYGLLMLVHDEAQAEVQPADAEKTREIGVWSIQEAGRQLGVRVPLDGEAKSGSNWAECH